jgi:hypothetical protein
MIKRSIPLVICVLVDVASAKPAQLAAGGSVLPLLELRVPTRRALDFFGAS